MSNQLHGIRVAYDNPMKDVSSIGLTAEYDIKDRKSKEYYSCTKTARDS